MTGVLIIWAESDSRDVCTEKRPWQDTLRQQPSASQGEKPQEKPNCQPLDLGLLAFKAMRKQISVV